MGDEDADAMDADDLQRDQDLRAQKRAQIIDEWWEKTLQEIRR